MRYRSVHWMTLFVATACALLGAGRPASAQARFATPDWYIDLSNFGYADFLIYTGGSFPGFNLHEMLSGEWGAAVTYDGLPARLTPPQRAMWFEPTWVYPDWTTNSTFEVIAPFGLPADSDGDGLPEGTSVIANADVQITLRVDPQDTVTGTPMGVRAVQPVLSNRYVMVMTYEVKNTTASALNNVRVFQFMHGHPANTEIPTVRASYDPGFYAGARSEYQYDVTARAQNSGAVDGEPTGCTFEDYVNLAARVAPGDWGLGPYRGHSLGKPAVGLHLDTENDALLNQVTFGPDEVAGAVRVDLGSIAAGETKSAQFLLAVKSVDLSPGQRTDSSCVLLTDTGGDPRIVVQRGACVGAQSGAPVDVITGDVRGLIESEGSVRLIRNTCVADDTPVDRVTVTDVVSPDCNPAVYILARRGLSQQIDWGTASSGEPRLGGDGACP